MRLRYFALVYGIIFLIVGICGFIPGLVTQVPVQTGVEGSMTHGYLFGLFPVNWLLNLVHILFGIWGLAAYGSISASRAFGQTTAIVYAILTVMGFIPVLQTAFGLAPLFGNDIWLHAVLAVIAAYFGWFARTDTVPAQATTGQRI